MRRRTRMEQNHIPHLTRIKSFPTKMGDLKMARFILDVMTDDISQVLDVIERDDFLSNQVTSIRCIDETDDNQFYSHDSFFTENVGQVTTSPMMNVLSKKQLENDREILSKY